MPSLDKTQASKTKRILVYGRPKSGKTMLVGKLAQHLQLDWWDIENGKDTLYQLPKDLQSRINMHSLPDSRVNPIAVETLLKIVKGGPMTVCIEHGKVNCPICSKSKLDECEKVNFTEFNHRLDHCVVFDSLTQLFNSAIANITRNKPEDYKLERDDWANTGKIMDTFLSQIQAARYNVVCISHELPVEMNDGKEKLVPVGGTKNFSRNTAKYFDEVIYVDVVNKAHKAASATTYANNVLTGSRSGAKLEESKEPDLWDLFK